jgi:hypothetical protein
MRIAYDLLIGIPSKACPHGKSYEWNGATRAVCVGSGGCYRCPSHISTDPGAQVIECAYPNEKSE